MGKAMIKTTIREIRGSLGRYLAILAIVLLGVGFFAGIKIARPAMIDTGNDYLNKLNFFDYRLVSTIGFTDEDVEKAAAFADVTAAEGSISVDAIAQIGDEEEQAYAVHSLTDSVNIVELTAGRMPESADECVLDNMEGSEDMIGQTFTVTANNTDDTLDFFGTRTFTIVGLVRSPYYMNFERGTTSIGNGKIAAFVYVPMEAFDSDVLTEIFLTMDEDYGIYTDEYNDYIDAHQDAMEEATEQLVTERFDGLMADAQAEIDDAWEELAENQADAEQELADALQELTDGEQEIADSEQEIADGWDAIAEAKDELDAQETALLSQEQEVLDQKAVLDDQLAQLNEQLAALDEQEAQLDEQQAALEEQAAQLGAQMTAALAQIEAGRAQIAAGRTQLEYAVAQLEDGLAQINDGLAQIADGKDQIAEARETIADNEQELTDGEQELADAKEELAQGRADYEDALDDFNTEIADAKAEIEDAQAELDETEDPDYYVLTRSSNVGYVCYESDTNIVAAIANIFPIFFFLVAALICITTMSRMVEEQRTQIGVLKALGYSNTVIMGKYLFYAGSAALIGTVVGYFGGTFLFSEVIWVAYGIMYDMGSLSYRFGPILAVCSLAAALICSMGSAWLSCRFELHDVPANLIRPKAPKNGKRIVLERITFLWKRMKFLHKVSARNIFRYKKRFFMMVIGISGCTALLLAGLGLKNSISNIIDEQFNEIQTYDAEVVFTSDLTQSQRDSFEAAVADEITEIAYRYEESADVTFGAKTQSVYLEVPEDADEMDAFLNLRTKAGDDIPYPGVGEAVISTQAADNLGVKVGDTVKILDDDMREMTLTISGICVNYVYNYLYINRETFESQTGESATYKSAYLHMTEDMEIHEAAAIIADQDRVMNVSISQDMQTRLNKMIGSVNYVVLLVILSAACLAFIVLYNLTNINITERIREIATIKVLGFYARETADYVFRENLILTAVGGLVGLALGKLLHWFIMYNIRVDMISFKIYISPVSYVLSFILTLVFAFLVNALMYKKLDRINMAESLKSIE